MNRRNFLSLCLWASMMPLIPRVVYEVVSEKWPMRKDEHIIYMPPDTRYSTADFRYLMQAAELINSQERSKEMQRLYQESLPQVTP